MRCAINERHRPVCVCLDECPDTTEDETVCGSDDRTYVNECELHKEACTSATNIRVAYKGLCLRGWLVDSSDIHSVISYCEHRGDGSAETTK